MTPKQERFIAEYLIDLNATQAAIRAGYSPKTAKQQASGLLSNVNLSGKLAEARAKQAEAAGIRASDVLGHMRHVGFSDPRRLLDERGNMLPMKDWPDDVAAAFSPLELTKRNLTAGDGVQEEVVKVKAWDKLKALERLGEHLGLWEPKGNVSGTLVVKWLK